MQHARLGIRLCLATLCATFTFATACGDSTVEQVSRYGRLEFALSAVSPSGVHYRLRNGAFTVTGESTASASTEDDLQAETISLRLRPGDYAIALGPGWFLEAVASDGSHVLVQATLTSANPQIFAIDEGKTSSAVFRFRVGDEVIVMGKGSVAISIDVDDSVAGTAGMAGTSATTSTGGQGAGGSESGGSTGLTCSLGYADCDGISANGCEANLNADNGNCGTCGNACLQDTTADTCQWGMCSCNHYCQGTCCPRDWPCEGGGCRNITTAYACGPGLVLCGYHEMCVNRKCVSCNSTSPRTPYNRCATCQAGYDECDGEQANGCESLLADDPVNCGACGNLCPTPTNTHSTCSEGNCGWSCNPGFGDCNGDASDGCERDVTGNCGICGIVEEARAVAVGQAHACALLGSGSVVCWGGDATDWSDMGTASIGTTPQKVVELPAVTAISANLASFGTCALLPNGTVQCWASSPVIPVAIGGITNAIGISGGGHAACALISDGKVKCWRWAGNAVEVSGLTHAVGLSVGKDSACAVCDDGSLQCWPMDTLQSTNVAGLSDDVTNVSVGAELTCARLRTGSVQCWGENGFGQLGNGTRTASSVPVTVVGVSQAVAVAAGRYNACALMADGKIQCWGDGNNSAWSDLGGAAAGISVSVGWTVGADFSCALLYDGSVACLGDNSWGELGNGAVLTPGYMLSLDLRSVALLG